MLRVLMWRKRGARVFPVYAAAGHSALTLRNGQGGLPAGAGMKAAPQTGQARRRGHRVCLGDSVAIQGR